MKFVLCNYLIYLYTDSTEITSVKVIIVLMYLSKIYLYRDIREINNVKLNIRWCVAMCLLLCAIYISYDMLSSYTLKIWCVAMCLWSSSICMSYDMLSSHTLMIWRCSAMYVSIF